jgi:uncharacterized protein (TIGR02145 family)
MRRIFLPVQLAAIACGVLALMACDGGSSGLMSPEDDDYTGYNRAGPVSSSGKGGAKSSSSERISSTNSSSSINSSSTINSSSGEDEGESYLSDDTLNTIIDKRDGEVYRVVKIGTQVWMAENLRYHDADANSLLAKHSWCVGEEGYCRQNGYVYDFAAVVNDLGCADDFCGILYPHRGICPEGFHVPKKAEWDTLQSNATRLNISLNAETGFTSAPTGEHGDYAKMDNCARYWTASQANSLAAYEFYRCGSETSFKSQSYSKDYGYALRCVADPGEVKVDRLVVPDESSSSLSEISSSSVESSSSSVESSSSEVSSSSVTLDDLETITDVRDGEVYSVMKVGTQVWMAENLRYTDSTETPALEGATFCWQDDPENCKTRGALYLWHAAMGKTAAECGYGYRCNEESPVRGICPEGFHVPTSSEWYDLRQYSSSLEKELIDIPTGEVDTRYGKSFASATAAHYWTSSEVNAQGAVTWYISNHDISSQDFDKRMGYALRCVKDAE